MKISALLLLSFFAISCSSNDTTENLPIATESYFPPLTTTVWETVNPTSLNWNTNNLQNLYDYLEQKDTKGFIILKDGKIAVEKYFNGHHQNASWNWYSAVKSLTALGIGIAEEEGFLNISDKISEHLGANWSSLTQEKQDLITVKHLLSMTSGLLNNTSNINDWSCTTPSCMQYFADAGTVWAYHQGAFIQTQNIVTASTGMSFQNYFETKILDKIGMQGQWNSFDYLNIFSSNTRSMARFGLLALNNGKWHTEQLINNAYFNTMTNTSQNLNEAYGYLWWLNGKDSFSVNSVSYSGSLIVNAPNDMLAALGANDQKIYVIPSKQMVVIRCGEDAGDNFDNLFWEKINAVID